ncbi:hypothetical protein [Dokdonella sp.]|uniref:hypothetical protein n=1 Tax=Dokdonella sp. TaxID=2291710 RepID=UPI00352802E6
MDILGDEDLFELLLASSASDLGELASKLTGGGRGRMAMHTAVKKLISESTLRGIYTPETIRIMINELQRFGGNTIFNSIQDKGVSYAKIVKDVLKHLGEAVDESASTHALELAVVNARLSRHWPRLSDAEKQEYFSALDVRRTIPCELSDLQEVVLLGGHTAASIAQRLARLKYAPPPSSGMASIAAISATVIPTLAILVAAGAAFRITIPCVLQIAYMRQKKATGALSFGGETNHELVGASDGDSIGSANDSPQGSTQPDLVLRNDLKPIVSILALSHPDSIEAQKLVAIDVPGIDRLAPLIQGLPSLAVGSELGTNRYVKVLVNGPLASAADGDGLRGFVRGSDGRLVEQARFYEDNHLANLTSGALLFQIASVALAQKHLADINQKLRDIKEGIERIHDFQINKRKSAIVGKLDYLRQVAPAILDGEMSLHVRQALEDCELALGAVQGHIRADLTSTVVELRTFRDPGKLGGNGLTAALKERQTRFEELAEQWLLCLAARGIACRLVCCYPNERKLVRQRSNNLKQIADDMLGVDGLVKQFTGATAKRGKELDGHFYSSSVETHANHERLRLWEIDYLKKFERNAHASMAQLDGMLRDNLEPVALVLEMQHDKIVRVMSG